jgi:putative transposase
MRFALIDGAKAEFPVHRLCRVLGLSQSGYFAWRGRLVGRRTRTEVRWIVLPCMRARQRCCP